MEPKKSSRSSMWCHVSDLHPNKMKSKSAIKVRLVRIYELPSPQNKKDIVSLDCCIFHDEKGDRIHATIPKLFIKDWQSTLKEGLLFGIKNFLVLHNSGKYKITTHPYKLKFNIQTDVKRMVDEEFPKKLYQFKPYEEVLALDEIKDGELFDIIVILLTTSEIRSISCQNGMERRILEIMLQDNEGKRISVTLWENYVNQFMHAIEKSQEASNIAILQLGRPNMFQGKMKMQSNFYVSKVMVNAKIKEVEEFRQRYRLVLDVVDDTEGATVVVWDRECKQLFGKSAIEIMESKEGLHDLPQIIKDTVMERKFLFKLSLKAKDDNEYNGSYSVMKLTTDLTYINSYNKRKSAIEETKCDEVFQENNVSMDTHEEITNIKTPSSKEDVESEYMDDGEVKRSLADEFSSTMPLKKTKVFIKKEKL